MCPGECEIGGSKCTRGVEGSVNRTIHVFEDQTDFVERWLLHFLNRGSNRERKNLLFRFPLGWSVLSVDG